MESAAIDPSSEKRVDQGYQRGDGSGNNSDVEGPASAVDDGLDEEVERRLVRKLDLHIIPLVMLLYLNSFIDR